jgi:acetyltransferase-like isoleucine patch superfamily enzyme
MTLNEILRRVRANPVAALEAARGLSRGQYYRLKFRLLGRRVVIGRFFRVSGPLDIRGPGRVEFGDFCTVASSRRQPTTPYTHSPDAVIKFGNRVMLTRTRLGCETLIEVGDNAGLAESWIMDSDFHSVELSDGPRYNTKGRSKPVAIGANAWIGAGAMVLKGVKIGANSVVGAGSVVASNVPPNAVVFGNPARVVWRLAEPKGPEPAAAATCQDGTPGQVA